MKFNSTIFLLATNPLFNKEAAANFESFDEENSNWLNASLILNHKELLNKYSKFANIAFCFDEKDREFLPAEFNDSHYEIIFGDTHNKPSFLKMMSDKYFEKSSNNILIFSNSIGYSISDIQKAFDLLTIEDEAVVIGKSGCNQIAFIGFNSFNHDLFVDIGWEKLTYDHFLSRVNKHENYLHVLGNFMSMNGLDDFKNLYIELSKKESLSYCSQEMHERFTHLFIEYKDLLK